MTTWDRYRDKQNQTNQSSRISKSGFCLVSSVINSWYSDNNLHSCKHTQSAPIIQSTVDWFMCKLRMKMKSAIHKQNNFNKEKKKSNDICQRCYIIFCFWCVCESVSVRSVYSDKNGKRCKKKYQTSLFLCFFCEDYSILMNIKWAEIKMSANLGIEHILKWIIHLLARKLKIHS